MQSNTAASTAALNYNGSSLVIPNNPQQAQLILNQLNANNLFQQQNLQQQQQQQQIHNIQKDTTFTKIFVGGLSYQTDNEALHKFFEKFGKIEEAVVITDRSTGKSRGYGFVTMETKEAAELAVADPNPVIDGRKANVNLAYLGVKSRIQPTTNFIPMAIRYPLSTQSSAYGFHPFWNANPSQTTFLSTHPNLLLTNQVAPTNQNSNPLTAIPNGTTAASTLFDLSSAYNNQMTNINSNRTSVEAETSNLGAQISNQNAFFHFNSGITSNLNNQPSLNNVLATQSNYFAFPPHLSNAFQS